MARSLDIIRAPKSKANRLDHNDFFVEEPPKSPKTRDPLIWYLLVGLILIVGAVVFSVYFVFIRPQNQSNQSEKNASQQLTTIPGTSKAQENEAPQPEPAKPQEPATKSLDKSQIKIRIVNGNGRQGEAAAMRDILGSNGFSSEIPVGNASSRYQTTIIYYNTDKIEAAKAIEEVVSQKYETSLMEAPKVTGEIYDVVVALGVK